MLCLQHPYKHCHTKLHRRSQALVLTLAVASGVGDLGIVLGLVAIPALVSIFVSRKMVWDAHLQNIALSLIILGDVIQFPFVQGVDIKRGDILHADESS